MSEVQQGIELIKRMGFDADLAKNLIEVVQLSVEAGRSAAIEQCSRLAADRAIKLRAKAKAQASPSRQSYFAQSIEARVIADSILALLPAKAPAVGGASRQGERS